MLTYRQCLLSKVEGSIEYRRVEWIKLEAAKIGAIFESGFYIKEAWGTEIAERLACVYNARQERGSTIK